MAKAIAGEYAKHGYDLYLAAGNSAELADFANDINARTQRVNWSSLICGISKSSGSMIL